MLGIITFNVECHLFIHLTFDKIFTKSLLCAIGDNFFNRFTLKLISLEELTTTKSLWDPGWWDT